jgi:hypothetical protein
MGKNMMKKNRLACWNIAIETADPEKSAFAALSILPSEKGLAQGILGGFPELLFSGAISHKDGNILQIYKTNLYN